MGTTEDTAGSPAIDLSLRLPGFNERAPIFERANVTHAPGPGAEYTYTYTYTTTTTTIITDSLPVVLVCARAPMREN